MNVITKTVQLPDGRTISIETGKVAKQADGAVVLRMNNTVLLATVCAAKDAVPGTDFMPLQVDYREQYYAAAGRFPGGFTKREGKASDSEILTSRLVDRVLRPLFPSDYHCEVYVQVMLLSADSERTSPMHWQVLPHLPLWLALIFLLIMPFLSSCGPHQWRVCQ
jgi:polyribonucleotide nucleotidyltransferase